MNLQFWGVRGSVPVSGPRYLRTGGNTSCVSLELDGHRLILDGGTGLQALGQAWGARPITASLLFTHLHWDHIQGVPFFGPAYHPESRLTLVGPRGKEVGGLARALGQQMRPPLFPITLDALRAELRWREPAAGEDLALGPFTVTAHALNHPDGVVAWKVRGGGRSLVFATDVEHAGVISPEFIEFCRGVDLLVHDAQFTAEEVPGRRGWGHSSVAEACQVAREAAVGALALFHHDPRRDDDAVAVLEERARGWFAGAFAAREGLGLVV